MVNTSFFVDWRDFVGWTWVDNGPCILVQACLSVWSAPSVINKPPSSFPSTDSPTRLTSYSRSVTVFQCLRNNQQYSCSLQLQKVRISIPSHLHTLYLVAFQHRPPSLSSSVTSEVDHCTRDLDPTSEPYSRDSTQSLPLPTTQQQLPKILITHSHTRTQLRYFWHL